jgi:hypothetical protein
MAQMEAAAERELALKPKRVTAARDVQYEYMGLTASIKATLTGGPQPPPPSPVERTKAEQWKQRILDECQDPSTIDCGHTIRLNETGGLRDLIFTDRWPDTTSEAQPFTVTVHRDGVPLVQREQSEITAVANRCRVSGLGFGTGLEHRVFTGKNASEWPALRARYEQLHGAPPTVFVECPISVTIPRPPAETGLWMAKDLRVFVRGKPTRIAGLVLRIDPQSLVIAAHPAP